MQCKHCGKDSMDHNAVTRGCPGGRKHRTHGWAWFHETQRFEAHKQCPHKRREGCAKAGPCLSPACGDGHVVTGTKEMQAYTAKLKSRIRMEQDIPAQQLGWWHLSAGQTLRNLRDATADDLDRCFLTEGSSTDPADYLCENFSGGGVLPRLAVARLTSHALTDDAVAKHQDAGASEVNDSQDGNTNSGPSKHKDFPTWFVSQHGKRPSAKSMDVLMRERNYLAAQADRAARLVEACELWDERRTSALWAWQAAPSN